MKPCSVLFLTGPTGSGKTSISLKLAAKLDAEIINADVGQFYQPLCVGTAKPNWKKQTIKHHLFDVLTEPKDLNVAAYRTMVLETLESLWVQGKLPIVVGGSLFYIKSLLFPASEFSGPVRRRLCEGGWEKLYSIDPERASSIDPKDEYRINRALAIWEQTGKKPFEFKPKFDPGFNAKIVFIDLPRDILFDRINKRTEEMIKTLGWVDEVRGLRGTSWEEFLKRKKLIGYPEIFDFLDRGAKQEDLPVLITLIQQKTRQYAKRQVTFWKKLRTLLECEGQAESKTQIITDATELLKEGRRVFS